MRGTPAKAAAKKVAAKPAAKKAAAKAFARPVAKKAAAKPSSRTAGRDSSDVEPGFTVGAAGIQVPVKLQNAAVVTPKALKTGLSKAKEAMKSTISDLVGSVADGFEITEMELSVSFDAKGSFLGFGVGGATSIKIKVKPV
jgi:hypothetical protein